MREIPRLAEKNLGSEESLWSLKLVSYQAGLACFNIHIITNIHRNM